jgi:hypothetical protein
MGRINLNDPDGLNIIAGFLIKKKAGSEKSEKEI